MLGPFTFEPSYLLFPPTKAKWKANIISNA